MGHSEADEGEAMVLAESILGNENNIFREIDTVYHLYLESKK